MSETETWRIEAVDGASPACDARGAAPLRHSEWVRLLLGEFLAPVRLSGTPDSARVEYLVAGSELTGRTPQAIRDSMRAAVAADLARLRAVLEDHRARIRDAAEHPERFDPTLFLDAYELLMATTVSDDPSRWALTDEGMCVTHWGLAEGPRQRPLLAWTEADVGRLQSDIERRLGQLPPVEAPDLGSKVTWESLKAALRDETRRASDGPVRKPHAKAQPRPSAAMSPAAPSPQQRARALREWIIIASAVFVSVVLLVWALVERNGRDRATRDLGTMQERASSQQRDLDDVRRNESALKSECAALKEEVAALRGRRDEPPARPAPGGSN